MSQFKYNIVGLQSLSTNTLIACKFNVTFFKLVLMPGNSVTQVKRCSAVRLRLSFAKGREETE